ncbi:MAG: hypothetical protein JWQ43_3448 [Glaciihabitans sp.]|nr:hypothetical protein [Glaciihabitans sp.]
MPAAATTAQIADIDGDGLADTEWMSESPEFRYGITTASGATFSLRDELAGPASHNGWTVTLNNGAIATVLDDGRTAQLYAVVQCSFTTPAGVNAQPYEFDMQNLRGNGTGVGCRIIDGGVWLGGYQIATAADGTRTVTFTEVRLAPDGSSATNGDVAAVATNVSEDDPDVVVAQRSSCLDAPVVSTSGK